MPCQNLVIRIARSMAEIDRRQWNACANPLAPASAGAAAGAAHDAPADAREERFNPFITHEFLHCLESSGAVGARAGWAPMHVLVETGEGQLVAAAPTYLKSHSLGEYVFDHGWAEAYEQAGGRYYPKLQVAVPFTPATGRRLLVRPGAEEAAHRASLVAGLRALCGKAHASSIHVTFLTRPEWEALGAAGFLQRTGKQFHFFNRGYATFEDFLGSLASRKRKMVRRERKDALGAGIEIERLTGRAIGEAHWDAFFAFYMDTGARKWGRPYLTRRFFSEVGAALGEHILLVMARRGGRYIAGAINFIGQDALYGRNWGAIEEHPFLHFEVCYYQAIEFAIERRLARVEAGAQGEHKLARGYAPVPIYSGHDISDGRFARAVADYLVHEREQVAEAIGVHAEHVPYRKA
jgi:hypothetical protein